MAMVMNRSSISTARAPVCAKAATAPVRRAMYVWRWSAAPAAFNAARAPHRGRRRIRTARAWQQCRARDRQGAKDAMITGHRGFSLVELLVSMAIMLAVTAAMFGLVNPAHTASSKSISSATDMQQRARASADAMFKDLVMAGAGRNEPADCTVSQGRAQCRCRRVRRSTDRLSVCIHPAAMRTAADRRHDHLLRCATDPPEASQLMRYDGRQSDLPVVDQVSGLRFEYFGADGQTIDRGRFTDGPWVPDAVVSGSLRCRSAGDTAGPRSRSECEAVARLIAHSTAPISKSAFDVSPRNLNLP